MGIIQRLFTRKKGSGKKLQKCEGEDPGYLACPVVAAELKRGKLDPPGKGTRAKPEDEVEEEGGPASERE